MEIIIYNSSQIARILKRIVKKSVECLTKSSQHQNHEKQMAERPLKKFITTKSQRLVVHTNIQKAENNIIKPS